MENIVKAVGSAFRPEMQDAEWEIIDELCADCEQHEARETFFPFFQGCGSCHGFIFNVESTDVQRQLGCCGCIVAMEMELRAAGIRPPPNKPAIVSAAQEVAKQDAQVKLLEKLIAMNGRGSVSKADLQYLCKGLRNGRARSTSRGPYPTRQMMTRNRLHKDKPPQAPLSRVKAK